MEIISGGAFGILENNRIRPSIRISCALGAGQRPPFFVNKWLRRRQGVTGEWGSLSRYGPPPRLGAIWVIGDNEPTDFTTRYAVDTLPMHDLTNEPLCPLDNKPPKNKVRRSFVSFLSAFFEGPSCRPKGPFFLIGGISSGRRDQKEFYFHK